VQQDAPFKVLSVALQELAVADNADGMGRHLVQEARRKDDFPPLQLRPVMEGHPAAAWPELTHGQGNDLALDDTLAVHPAPVLGQERRPRFGVLRHHLKGSGLPPGPGIRRALQDGQPPAVVR
jgi:hypothetical protein